MPPSLRNGNRTQALARNRCPHLQVRRQPADWHGAGGHTWSKDLLLLRALPLKERFTIIDAVSKPTPPRLRSPIGARGAYSLFLVCAKKDISFCARVSNVMWLGV